MGKRLEFALESYALMTLISRIRVIEFGGLDLNQNIKEIISGKMTSRTN